MKKTLCSILAQILFCVLIFGGGIVPPRQDPNKPEWVKGEVLIRFKDDVELQLDKSKGIIETGLISIDKLIQKWQVTDIEKVFKNEEKRTESKTITTYTGEIIEVPQLFNIYKMKLPDDTDVEKAVEDFEINPNVEYAEPNYIARICVIPDDTSFSNQWGLHNTGQYHLTDADIDAPEAWDIETGDSTVIIGILDTGVDYGHPDLTDNVISTGYDFVNNDDDAMDDNGHGSHVAGTAAATTNNAIGIAGVAWNCKILPVKVLQSNGYGTYSDVASGVNYAANNGAKVINLSLGGYASSYVLQNALENAYTTSVIVGAAGNGGTSVPFYPAAWSFVIGVGASDVLYNPITQTWYETKAVFSNYGINADLYAPGVNIYSTIPLFHPHTYSYASWNGTSMAAPFVTGTVALLRSHYSGWSNELIHGQLVYTSDGIVGGIRLNAYESLTEIAVPQLSLYSHTIVDTLPGCDHDGIADAGETVEMVFDILNTWEQAYNVEAILSYHSYEDTCFVTILDSVSTFGGVSSYAHVNNETNPFRFYVKTSTPNNTDVYFDYEITCDTGYSFTGTFHITTQRGIEIGGIIWSDETWTNDYLYIVIANSLVDEGVTLTIEPGTRIQFNDYYLRIDGCLVSAGTEDSTIVFTSNAQNPSAGDWNGIKFADPSLDAQFDVNGNYVSGSIIQHAEIEFGGGINVTSASPYIANNYMHDNSGNGTCYLSGSCSSRVEYNIFRNNSAGRGGGIYLFYCSGTPIIAYNLMEDNFVGDYGGGVGYCSCCSNVNIHHNIIRGNHSGGTGSAIGGVCGGYISNNVMYDNTGGSAVYFYGGQTGLFRFNTITNNTGGIYPRYVALVDTFSYNNIYNNHEGSNYEIHTSGWGGEDFHVEDNYWNTTITDSIDAWIWDYYDDFDLRKVIYQPFETTPVTDAPGFLYQVEFNPPPPIGCETDTFNLTFSKPMDISIQPYVTFGVCEPYTQHIIEGSWVDSTHWQGAYTFGIMTGDGINHLRVTTAQDCEGMEIPKDTRFSFVVDATGASSVGFIAQAGIGKVDLEWNGQDMVDLMGYNMYRYHKITDTTYSDTTLINTSMITDTTYCDMSVIPNTTYYYMYTGISTDFIESGYSDPASATPFDADPGDANGDLLVDVLDITTVIAFMLNQNPQPFLFDAADVNGDDVINVLDIIGIVDIILGKKKLVSQVIGTNTNPAYIYLDPDGIRFKSEGQVAAMQFELSGQNLEQIRLLMKQQGFEFASGIVNDQLIGILYNFQNRTIPEGMLNLIGVENRASNISWGDVVAGDPEGNYVLVLKDEPQPLPVEDYELRAFPNPFKETVTITYKLYEPATITLQFYNSHGQLIQSIENREKPVGSHKLEWNGKGFPAGIYYCRLNGKSASGKEFNSEVKIVLIK